MTQDMVVIVVVKDGGDGDGDGEGSGRGGDVYVVIHLMMTMTCRQTLKILKGEIFLQQGISGSMWTSCTQPDSRLQAGRGMMIPLRNIAPKVNQPLLPNHADIMSFPIYIHLHQIYLN